MGDLGGNVGELIAGATAGTLLLGALAKLVSVLQRGGNGDARKLDLESFKARLADLKDENRQLRDDLLLCEKRLDARREMVHDLADKLTAYQLMHGELPKRPDLSEDEPPKLEA